VAYLWRGSAENLKTIFTTYDIKIRIFFFFLAHHGQNFTMDNKIIRILRIDTNYDHRLAERLGCSHTRFSENDFINSKNHFVCLASLNIHRNIFTTDHNMVLDKFTNSRLASRII